MRAFLLLLALPLAACATVPVAAGGGLRKLRPMRGSLPCSVSLWPAARASCRPRPNPTPRSALRSTDGEIASFAEGLADRQIAPPPSRIDDPARVASVSKLVVADRRDEAGRSGQARPRPRRLRLSRLDACATPLSPTGRSRFACCSSHTSSVREHDDNYVIPLGASLQAAMQDPLEWDAVARPRRPLFRLHQHELPDRRLGRRAGHGRALRHLDARATCSSR